MIYIISFKTCKNDLQIILSEKNFLDFWPISSLKSGTKMF